MRDLPDDLETGELVEAVAAGWELVVDGAEYAALGAGSYHWVVSDRDGSRRFVTVDDLDQKAWLGDTREAVYDGLRRAFDTAAALRAAGLTFVVAPIPARGGETVRRLGERHTVALFPFVDGSGGQWGPYDDGARAAVLSQLAELHLASPAAASVAGTAGLGVPGRGPLEAALQDLDRPWSGGPFSEPAREVISGHAADIAALLSLTDRLAARVEQRAAPWVVTHGEPHAGNVMRVGDRHVLVDWDTVALAPRERDLWWLADGPSSELTRYRDVTGQGLDQDAVEFFRIAWELSDVAEYLKLLRSPHVESEDTVWACETLPSCVATATSHARRIAADRRTSL